MATSKLADTLTNGGLPDGTTDDAIFKSVAKMTLGQDYTAGDTIPAYGQAFTANPKLLNSFLDNFAIKYGAFFIKGSTAINPFDRYKRGLMSEGGKLEVITWDAIQPEEFTWADTATNPFRVNVGPTHADTFTYRFNIHSNNSEITGVDKQYFNNAATFNDWLFGKWAALITGAKISELETMMSKLQQTIDAGKMKVIDAGANADIVAITSAIHVAIKKFGRFKRDYNSIGYAQGTAVSEIDVLIPDTFATNMDLQVAMNAFNAEMLRNYKVNYVSVPDFEDYEYWTFDTAHTVTQDDVNAGYFDLKMLGAVIPVGATAPAGIADATKKIDGSKIKAMVIDRDVIRAYDDFIPSFDLETNAGGRVANLWYNQSTLWGIATTLNNAVVTTGTPLITAP